MAKDTGIFVVYFSSQMIQWMTRISPNGIVVFRTRSQWTVEWMGWNDLRMKNYPKVDCGNPRAPNRHPNPQQFFPKIQNNVYSTSTNQYPHLLWVYVETTSRVCTCDSDKTHWIDLSRKHRLFPENAHPLSYKICRHLLS